MLSIYHNLLFRIRSNQYLISRQNKHQMFKFIERMVCICDFSTFHRKHGSICNLIWTSCMKNNIWFRIRCRHISRVEFSLAIAMATSSRLCDIEYSVVLSKKRILTIRPPFDITLENGIFAGKSVCFRIYKSFWKWHSPSQRVRFVPFHSRNNQSDWIKIAAIYNINEWKWFKVTFFSPRTWTWMYSQAPTVSFIINALRCRNESLWKKSINCLDHVHKHVDVDG